MFHPESIDATLIPSSAELEFLVAASTYAIEYCPVEGDSRLLTLVTGGGDTLHRIESGEVCFGSSSLCGRDAAPRTLQQPLPG